MHKEKENSRMMTKEVIKYMISLINKKQKKTYFIYAIKFLGLAFGEAKVLLLPKLLIDELTLAIANASFKEHLRNIIIYVAITLIMELLSKILCNISDSCKAVVREQLDAELTLRMCDKSMSMDFQYTEDPEVLEKKNRAQEGKSWYSGGAIGVLDCVFNIIYQSILVVVAIMIMVIYCPLLLPIQLLAMVLVTYFNYKNQKINTKSFLELAKNNRLFGYYFYELSDFRLGKDIRMYDSSKMMCEKADYYAKEQANTWKRQSTAQLKNNYGSNIVNAFRDVLSYLYMGIRAIKGVITIGDFTICISAASRLFQGLMQSGQAIVELNEKCNYAHRFIEYMNYPSVLYHGDKLVEEKEHIIEFRDVSFKYPRSEEYVLKHVNLTINPGEHLSVVGLNGAGKTTFIKLLCRLYDVTDGTILIDGIDIREYSIEEYQKNFSVVFQDFMLFAFSLKENIMLGNIDEDNEDKMDNVLKLSGLYDDVPNLEKGIDTILFKSFDEHGTELSGGQKQKAAIARALYRGAPIVILDEPTAALDPIAENDVYKKFDTLVGGKTAIYVSHRLSSCKFCDKIAVFADNTIKEYGTHDELIDIADGLYATMFKTQAQYYIENSTERCCVI